MVKAIRFRTRTLLILTTALVVLIVSTPMVYNWWAWASVKPSLEQLLADASFQGQTDGDYILSHESMYFILDNHLGALPTIDTRALPNEQPRKQVATTNEALDHWKVCYLARHGWNLW